MATLLKTSGIMYSDTKPTPSVSEGQIHDRLTSKAIETIREIARDHDERLAGYKGRIQLLGNGIFYPNEYFTALELTNQSKRIEWLVRNGSFFHGFASPKHFTMVPDRSMPSGVVPYCFVVKEGVSPGAALDAMRQGVSFIGCGEACQIAYYEAIRDVLGAEKFDFLFSANSSTPLKLHFSSKDNPLISLLKEGSSDSPAPGQIVYFQNSQQYPAKHMFGEAQGYTTICCDDTKGQERFAALGLRPEGTSREDLNQTLIEAYNADPVGMKIVSPELGRSILETMYSPRDLAVFKKNQSEQLTPDLFRQTGGGEILGSYQLNAARIALLANGSLEEARKLLDRWHKATCHKNL